MPSLVRESKKRNLSAIIISFNPASATAQNTGKVLPPGAVPIGCRSLGGGTGGTTPIADIGTAADPDGFAAGIDADGIDANFISGALTGVALTVPTPIYANGRSGDLATGGTCRAVVYYVIKETGGE